MAATVLAILNMKGGVGKTTVSAHVMRVFYQRMQKRVLLIDLDAQFNLTQAVVQQDKYDQIQISGHTVLSCFEPLPSNDFFQVRHTDQAPPSATDICFGLRNFKNSDLGKLDLIPGAFELMKYSMIDDAAQLRHASDYLKRFISQARDQYDLIVLDCNPSSSFVTKCALENATHVLSPVKPDKFSVLGVGMVDRLFDHLGLTLNHMVLVNNVPRHDPMSSVEVEMRAHPKFGPKVLRHRLPISKFLTADPSYTGFATDRKGPYSGVLRREINDIVDELSVRMEVN